MFKPFSLPAIAVLPRAPKNGSPVPGLTSLYHKTVRGPYGSAAYPGNCSGELIKDLLRYFKPKRVLDPMTGSGTCADVCQELGIECRSTDLQGRRFDPADACDPASFQEIGRFDFVWIHPPYWRQKVYSNDPRDLSVCTNLESFLSGYRRLIANCSAALNPGGRLAVLMGDYDDREAGFVPLTFHTKRLAFDAGLKQCCTDIIRFSHGASSSKKIYRSSFIPGLHDTCMIFEKSRQRKTGTDAPSAHRRPECPSAGCIPTEPDSVSAGKATVHQKSSGNTPSDIGALPQKSRG